MKTNEFVIHCADLEYDYYYNSISKRKIITHISKVFKVVNGFDLLIFEIDNKSLRSYVTTKKEKKRDPMFSKMPMSGGIFISVYNGSTVTSLRSFVN